MGTKPKSVDTILFDAVEIGSPNQRAVYLDEVCGSDADLRVRVEKLIRAHIRAGRFLEEPVVGECPTDAENALSDTDESYYEIAPSPCDALLNSLATVDGLGRLKHLGPYQVQGVIGRGGMGVVLRAHDPKLNRVVAIKILAPEFGANQTARKRFLREARAAAAINHSNVVATYGVDETDSIPYLVMEHVAGQTLKEKIDRDGILQTQQVLSIGAQIAAGLAAAHHHGLTHRDIKPANILLEDNVERVKITDFGIARAVDDIGITGTGQIVGTPEFMSPEQAQGLDVEPRSDLFSLGSVLYTMCTGQSPFRADTAVAVLRRVCDDVPTPIDDINPETPDYLVWIIDRLLAKAPEERLQTADEVAELLSQYLADSQYTLRSSSTCRTVRERAKKSRVKQGSRTTQPQRHFMRQLRFVAGLILLAAFVGLGVTEATGVTQLGTTVIRIVTGEGTLVIRVADPAVSVAVEGQDVVITGVGTGELRLRPGTYRLRAQKDGQPVAIKQESISISRGARELVHVTVLPFWEATLPADAPGATEAPVDAKRAKEQQQAWAEYLGQPIERTIVLPGDAELTLVLIPPGEFLMGTSSEEQLRMLKDASADDDAAAIRYLLTEGPQHCVRITKPFYLGKHELTNAQWEAIASSEQATGEAPTKPVVGVTWNEIQPLLDKLTREQANENLKFVLPTEAQWEYACRAGTATPWYFGDSADTLSEIANTTDSVCEVGTFLPNAWGLHDMHGNVWEWCQDWFSADYYEHSPLNDPCCTLVTKRRANRGGVFNHLILGGVFEHPVFLRSACRNHGRPAYDHSFLGFRMAAMLVD